MKKFLLSSVFLLLFSFVMVSKTNAQCAALISQAFSATVSGSNVTYSFSITYPNGNSSIFVSFYCPNGTLLRTECFSNQGNATISYSRTYAIGGCNPLGQYYITAQAWTNNQCGGRACGGLVRLPLEAPLPVKLVNFNAIQKNNKVSLTWETATELNNSGFEIERRSATGKYEKIGFVASKAVGGNGFDYAYSFEDNSTLAKGVTYYRLRQVDIDARATYSEIRGVRTGKGLIVLSVYPNPSRGTTNVAIPSGIGSVDVSVDDFTGKSVQRFLGVTTSNLQLTNLKPGIYMVRVNIRATGEVISEKIAVQ